MLARARRRIVRMIDGFEFFALPFRIILDHDLQRPQHRHAAQRRLVEILADAEFQHADVDHAVGLGDADALDEFADRRRRHAAPLQAGDGRHPRIVPAGDMAAAHQFGQHPLRQQRVGQVEPRDFVLTRLRRHRQPVQQPFIERPVVLEFQRADRMRDALDRVGLAVGVIVARIDRPGVAGARMGGVQDAIEHGVAQVDIARGHIDLGAQHPRAVGKLAGLHAAEQIEVFLHRAVAERAVLAGLGQRAALDADFLLRLVVDIGVAGPDQALGPFVQPLEIIRGVIEVGSPVVAEPAHVGLNRIDVFLLFLGRIGVVEAQVAAAGKFLGDAEIECNRLGMADMQIAVRLRREARHDLAVFPGVEVGLDDVANEIAACLCRHRFCCHAGSRSDLADLLPNPHLPRKALVMHGSCYTPPRSAQPLIVPEMQL